jgi:hypothetical protein
MKEDDIVEATDRNINGRSGLKYEIQKIVGLSHRIRETTEIDCPQDLYTKQTFALGLRAIPFILQRSNRCKS